MVDRKDGGVAGWCGRGTRERERKGEVIRRAPFRGAEAGGRVQGVSVAEPRLGQNGMQARSKTRSATRDGSARDPFSV